ncbi:MAG: hypothetical protein ACK4GR_04755 [bacterium]
MKKVRIISLLVVVFAILFLVYTNFIVNGISIISNKPQVSFIDSKDFFESYYGNRDSVILDLRNYKSYR